MRRKYELMRRAEDRKFENERWIDEKRKHRLDQIMKIMKT